MDIGPSSISDLINEHHHTKIPVVAEEVFC